MSNRTTRTRLVLTFLESREVPAVLLPGDGLKATYYDNDNFTGPSVTRVDPQLSFDWKRGAPAAGIGGDTFSVRWTGTLVPKFSETYTFHTYSDDGIRVWVNNKLVIDNWTDHSATENWGRIALTAGQPVNIRVDYFEGYADAVVGLRWSSRSQANEVIPTASLYSGTPKAAPAPVPVPALIPVSVPTPVQTPVPTAPAAPSALQATASGTTIQLGWADNSTDETGFRIERSLDGLNYAAVATVGANATSYTDTGLPAGTAVTYRVRAVNAVGASTPTSTATARTADAAAGNVVYVSTTAEFRAAVNAATPGTTILLRAGVYDGGNYFANIQGTADRHIVIAAADAASPPVFRGGAEGLHFTDSAYLELRNLVVEGQSDNGINIDDGGTYDTPSHDITLSGITVRNVGGGGNQDAVKLSGVDRFTVENSSITAWGAGGSGIDMVGCHDGLVANSYFANGDAVGANGLEAKGGSARIAIRGNRFEHAGERAVQIGGSTETPYFRFNGTAGSEAADMTVEGNVIVGSEAAVAFVNSDNATVRFNTIVRPTDYVFRILQETTADGFVPTRNGVVSDNIIVFDAGTLRTAVNVGTGTAPETFSFARNAWYAADLPAASRPSLPVAESNGMYGIDPGFLNAADGDYHTAMTAGAYAAR